MISGTLRPLALPLPAAMLLAAAAGAILDAGFPDRSWWILALVGVFLMLFALLGRGFWSGLLIGLVAGSAFWLIHISWLTLYLGPVPWLALAGLQTIFFCISLALIGVVLETGPRVWPTSLGRLGVVPVVVAGLWTAREALASVWPYGGFAWGRVAISQSESPFNSLVAWVGMSGLSFVLVWLCALALQLLRETPVRLTVRSGIAAGTIAVVLVVPAWPTVQTGEVRLAAIQGASDAGLFARYSPGQILADHTSATLAVIDEEVDFVVWPENASDIDPLRSTDAAKNLDFLSRRMGVPIIAGAITQRNNKIYNSSLLWQEGEGAVDIYDKVHPVPFAEYMPDRAFWRPFAPELIDLVARDYAIGTRDNVFDINGIVAGLAICFDIADDQLVQEMVDDKAEIILAQTNNADFGRTDESVQQLAIARLRAIEAGRTVVNISTVGTSAIITPDGATLDSLPTWLPGAMVQSVPLSDTVTPAMAAGRVIEWLVCGLGLAGFVLCSRNALRARRNRARSM
ncbi:apolipoprotein N-acyltransferase [Cryobacterium sp. TMT1-62]|uniref:apolipoprotein N-acyltransferase n=1 Tax=Cryobacterium sp. TMT1-62 TaxID=1259240 RepID=UPI001F543A14|nr:apolipoprotein N-acyltransferase [Cryobacterium sp. TMT1-62]